MSPLSTVLPPTQVEWVQEFYLPSTTFNPTSVPTAAADTLDRMTMRHPVGVTMLPSTLLAARGYTGYGAAGTTATTNMNVRHQRRCVRMLVNPAAINGKGSGWRPPEWLPSFGPASEMSPGARLLDGAVVGVFDWHFSMELAGAVPNWEDDTCPMMWYPVGGFHSSDDVTPGTAGAWVGGFGVFLNDDGGGGSQYEYVSYTSGSPGAIRERVVFPAAAIPDLDDWHTIRTIVVSAASGREAFVTIQANGVDVLTRDFGNGASDIQRPDDASPGPPSSTGLVCGINIRGSAASPSAVNYQHTAKFGRFTPDGAELQGA